MHMGHVRVYTICDVLARYYKSKGYDVINPMGWDSFGLPAENAARDRGVAPRDWTKNNIEEVRQQLEAIGYDFNWEREVSTCEPDYYKHTQGIFASMVKRNCASKADALVNWDPVD